jgi:hypothetical protein
MLFQVEKFPIGDTVDAITYKFSTGNSASFNIASDGRITTNAILDYETIPQYIFTVMTKIFTTCKHCYVKIKIGRSFTSN